MSTRTIAPFLKSTRNSGVPSKYPVNELICGSCPTSNTLGSPFNARTSAHVSPGEAIGVNAADRASASSYPRISAASSAVCLARTYGLVTITDGSTLAVRARFKISRSRFMPSAVNARSASAWPGLPSSAMPCRNR